MASIGIGVGKHFDIKDLSLAHKAEVLLGMKAGDDKVDKYITSGGAVINGWNVGSFFGDRAFYNGDWLKRAAAAKGGIFGNSAIEAMYPLTRVLPRRRDRRQQTQLHPDLRQRRSATGERVLVSDDVRQQNSVSCRQPDQPLLDQFTYAAGDDGKS
jgi:hypothetical protein